MTEGGGIVRFVRASGRFGGGSELLAIVLFGVSIFEHFRDKNVSAYWLVFLAGVFFAIGAYRAWAFEHSAFAEQVKEDSRPLLVIEHVASFFDVSRVPSSNQLQVHVCAYLRVTNRNTPETLIKDGTLVMEVNGIRYRGAGDDANVKGNVIEHNSNVRVGGEIIAPDVFGNTLSPFTKLASRVTPANPLRRGITQEGFYVFTFSELMDWDRQMPYVIPTRDAVFTLRDTFGGSYELQLPVLEIPNGTVKTVPQFEG